MSGLLQEAAGNQFINLVFHGSAQVQFRVSGIGLDGMLWPPKSQHFSSVLAYSYFIDPSEFRILDLIRTGIWKA